MKLPLTMLYWTSQTPKWKTTAKREWVAGETAPTPKFHSKYDHITLENAHMVVLNMDNKPYAESHRPGDVHQQSYNPSWYNDN